MNTHTTNIEGYGVELDIEMDGAGATGYRTVKGRGSACLEALMAARTTRRHQGPTIGHQ